MPSQKNEMARVDTNKKPGGIFAIAGGMNKCKAQK